MRKPISWEEYWIKQAELIAQRSKDPITQVGAVVIDKDNRQRAAGYNGFPRGVKETDERWERPLKYKFAVHAEINLIANAVGWVLDSPIVQCILRFLLAMVVQRQLYKQE